MQSNIYKNKIVLVTGAGGSIGSEICKQLDILKAKQIILVDNSEYNLYISSETLNKDNIFLLRDITNKKLMNKTFNQYLPEIVIHAAAFKHLPLCEDNIEETIINNVIGTKNIINLSVKYKVKTVINISTDKAVNPTSIMGVSKRIAELYSQNSCTKETDIVSVRFGNILNSSGSVIPKFNTQIQNNKKVTVTHPDIRRYFMSISTACSFVLSAGTLGQGRTFVLDMGEPVKILDIAKRLITESGKNIDIEFIGLRHNEKLEEELYVGELLPTEAKGIKYVSNTLYDLKQLNKDISKLLKSKNKLKLLKKIVPEFNHKGI